VLAAALGLEGEPGLLDEVCSASKLIGSAT
jgi:hypothetical protein